MASRKRKRSLAVMQQRRRRIYLHRANTHEEAASWAMTYVEASLEQGLTLPNMTIRRRADGFHVYERVYI